MPANANLGQSRANFPVKPVAVHAQVGGGVAQTDQAGLDLHRLSPYVDGSNLGSDMAQLGTDGQAGPLIGLLLCCSKLLFGGPARMG